MISVLSPGLLTTVQDRGRPGHRASGMPVAGAVDRLSLAAANLIAGNDPWAAALEMTLVGGTFRFEGEVVAALAGADMGATIDGCPVPPGTSFRAAAGAVLATGPARRGVRAYLAVQGGVAVPPVLGSRSTYVRGAVGGLDGRALEAGDAVPVGRRAGGRPVPRSVDAAELPEIPPPGSCIELRVLRGPQDDLLPAAAIDALFSTRWLVTPRNDRMGYRLDGPALPLGRGADIVTDGLLPGAVQVAGDGRPMVLLVDAQTTGGYAKPCTVIGPDLRRIAQCRSGDGVRFVPVSMERAVAAVAEERAWLAALARRLADGGGAGGETG